AFLGKEYKRKKTIFWSQAGSLASLNENWKGVLNKNEEFQLFDIVKDPSELNNVKAEYPAVAAEMEKSLREWQKKMSN
ncbi:MAG: hypothetical protein J7L73_07260, partial [Anaerolineales bacterium]|nr:hypothetical protein [Anaerolineales bacterium]